MHWTVIGWSQRSSVFCVKSKKKQVGVLTFLNYKPWTMDGITTLCVHAKHGAGWRHLCFLNTNWCKKKKKTLLIICLRSVGVLYVLNEEGGHSSPPQTHLPLCVCHHLALEYSEGQLCSSSVIFIRLNRNAKLILDIEIHFLFCFACVLWSEIARTAKPYVCWGCRRQTGTCISTETITRAIFFSLWNLPRPPSQDQYWNLDTKSNH